MNQAKKLKSVGDILSKYDWDNKNKYISREFQDYGYRLAEVMEDVKQASLYIKLAKEMPREWLEEAKNFVKGADNVRSKPKLFMWKLTQIKKARHSPGKTG